MDKEQWKLYKDFCKFADIQDNSDAEIPNATPGLAIFMDGSPLKNWDPLDDPTMVSPEFLIYILLKAQEFWSSNGQQ